MRDLYSLAGLGLEDPEEDQQQLLDLDLAGLTSAKPAKPVKSETSDEPAASEEFEAAYARLETKMRELGQPIKRISKYRDPEKQNQLYQIGRTVKGKNATPDKPMGDTVTNADGYEKKSRHQSAEAFDVVFERGQGNWNELGRVAKAVGLEWGGDFRDIYDPGHVQWPKAKAAEASQSATEPAAGFSFRRQRAPNLSLTAIAQGASEPEPDALYQAWLREYGVTNPDDPKQFYDYRAAFKAGATPDASGHWPSEFKKPGHPNEVVGGFNTRTGQRVSGTTRAKDAAELVSLGYDQATANRLAATPEPTAPKPTDLDLTGMTAVAGAERDAQLARERAGTPLADKDLDLEGMTSVLPAPPKPTPVLPPMKPGEARLQSNVPKPRTGILGPTIDTAAGVKDYIASLFTTIQWTPTTRAPILSREGEGLIPFNLGETARALQVLDAARRVAAGRGSDADERDVTAFLERDAPPEGARGYGFNIARTAANIVPFAIEFGMTGGVYTGTKKVVTEGVEAAVKKLLGEAAERILKNRATRIVGNVASSTAGVMAHTAAQTTRLSNETMRREVDSIMKNEDDGFITSFFKAYADLAVESGSERMGGPFEALMKKLTPVKIQGLKQAVMNRWLKLDPNRTVLDFAKQVRSDTGWNGIFGEMMEERIGAEMRALLPGPLRDEEYRLDPSVRIFTGAQADPTGRTVADNPRWEAAKDLFNQMATEAVAFALPGLGTMALATAARQGPAAKKAALVNEYLDFMVTLPDRPDPASPEGQKLAEIEARAKEAGVTGTDLLAESARRRGENPPSATDVVTPTGSGGAAAGATGEEEHPDKPAILKEFLDFMHANSGATMEPGTELFQQHQDLVKRAIAVNLTPDEILAAVRADPRTQTPTGETPPGATPGVTGTTGVTPETPPTIPDEMRTALLGRGHTEDAINAMTPEQATDILNTPVPLGQLARQGGWRRGPGEYLYQITRRGPNVLFSKMHEGRGSQNAFYVGADGTLITDGNAPLWTPQSKEAADQAMVLLDQMAQLELSDPRRNELKQQLVTLVTTPAAATTTTGAKPTGETTTTPPPTTTTTTTTTPEPPAAGEPVITEGLTDEQIMVAKGVDLTSRQLARRQELKLLAKKAAADATTTTAPPTATTTTTTPEPEEEKEYTAIRDILEGTDITARRPYLKALFPEYDTDQPDWNSEYHKNVWGELNEPTRFGPSRLFFTDLNKRIREAREQGRLPKAAAGETTTTEAPTTTSEAPTYRYIPTYRPPSSATVPKGWRLVERGTGGFFPKRTDLPEGRTKFGIIEFDRELTQEEVKQWELERTFHVPGSFKPRERERQTVGPWTARDGGGKTVEIEDQTDAAIWDAMHANAGAEDRWERARHYSDEQLDDFLKIELGDHFSEAAGGYHVQNGHIQVHIGAETNGPWMDTNTLRQKIRSLLDERRPEGKAPEEPEAADPLAPIVFRSGNSRSINDLQGFINAGRPVGIAALSANPDEGGAPLRPSANVIALIVQYARSGGQVFIDSGAFTIDDINFSTVFSIYMEIVARVGKANASNLHLVMPDKVGDAERTRQLQEEHADRITKFTEDGATIIVPVQVSDEMETDAVHVTAQWPTAHIGLPGNVAAISQEQLEAVVSAIEQASNELAGVHFLGLGERGNTFDQFVETVRQTFPYAVITTDSTRVRAMMQGARPGRVAVEGETDRRAHGAVDVEPEADTTELGGALYRGDLDYFSEDEIAQLAKAAGLSVDALTEGVSNDEPSEFLQQTGMEQAIDLAIFHIAKARMVAKHRPGARRDVITSFDGRTEQEKADDAAREERKRLRPTRRLTEPEETKVHSAHLGRQERDLNLKPGRMPAESFIDEFAMVLEDLGAADRAMFDAYADTLTDAQLQTDLEFFDEVKDHRDFPIFRDREGQRFRTRLESELTKRAGQQGEFEGFDLGVSPVAGAEVPFTADNLEAKFLLDWREAEAAIELAEAMGFGEDDIDLTRGGVPGAGALRQRPVNAAASRRWYYSNLSKALESFPKKGTLAQWQAHVKKFKGAAEEDREIGFTESFAIAEKEGLTRKELQAYLDRVQIHVETIVLGPTHEFATDDPTINEAVTTLLDHGFSIIPDEDGSPVLVATDTGDVASRFGLPPAAQEAWDRIEDEGRTNVRHGESHLQLPGGVRYREVLLRLLGKPIDTRGWTATIGSRGQTADIYEVHDASGKQVANVLATSAHEAVVKAIEQQQGRGFASSHWAEPNVLAWLRLNDRLITTHGFVVRNKKSGHTSEVFATKAEAEAHLTTLPESLRPSLTVGQGESHKRILFVEEIQSDWHQGGRDYGYMPELAAKIFAIETEMVAIAAKPVQTQEDKARHFEITKERAELIRRSISGAVPGAPFKSAGWKKLALKRLLALASQEGYDGVAWTTGEQQAARYKLSKKVDAIEWGPPSAARALDGAVRMVTINLKGIEEPVKLALLSDGTVYSDLSRFHGKPLGKVIGREVAQKIISASEERGELRGEKMDLGGHGMRAFYDQELPNLMNDLVKKHGVKVGRDYLSGIGETVFAYRGPTRTRDEVQAALSRYNRANGFDDVANHLANIRRLIDEGNSFEQAVTWRESQATAAYLGGELVNLGFHASAQVHYLELPQRLRQEVRDKGLPLFQDEKAAVEFPEGGKALMRARRGADISSVIHELAHIGRRMLMDLNISAERRAGITDEDIVTAAKWAGAELQDGVWVWSEAAEEKFARGFERYLYDGTAPNKLLERLFGKLATWLRDIYKTLEGSGIDVDISPAMRQVYDKLVQRADAIATQQYEATEKLADDLAAAAAKKLNDRAAAAERIKVGHKVIYDGKTWEVTGHKDDYLSIATREGGFQSLVVDPLDVEEIKEPQRPAELKGQMVMAIVSRDGTLSWSAVDNFKDAYDQWKKNHDHNSVGAFIQTEDGQRIRELDGRGRFWVVENGIRIRKVQPFHVKDVPTSVDLDADGLEALKSQLAELEKAYGLLVSSRSAQWKIRSHAEAIKTDQLAITALEKFLATGEGAEKPEKKPVVYKKDDVVEVRDPITNRWVKATVTEDAKDATGATILPSVTSDGTSKPIISLPPRPTWIGSKAIRPVMPERWDGYSKLMTLSSTYKVEFANLVYRKHEDELQHAQTPEEVASIVANADTNFQLIHEKAEADYAKATVDNLEQARELQKKGALAWVWGGEGYYQYWQAVEGMQTKLLFGENYSVYKVGSKWSVIEDSTSMVLATNLQTKKAAIDAATTWLEEKGEAAFKDELTELRKRFEHRPKPKLDATEPTRRHHTTRGMNEAVAWATEQGIGQQKRTSDPDWLKNYELNDGAVLVRQVAAYLASSIDISPSHRVGLEKWLRKAPRKAGLKSKRKPRPGPPPHEWKVGERVHTFQHGDGHIVELDVEGQRARIRIEEDGKTSDWMPFDKLQGTTQEPPRPVKTFALGDRVFFHERSREGTGRVVEINEADRTVRVKDDVGPFTSDWLPYKFVNHLKEKVEPPKAPPPATRAFKLGDQVVSSDGRGTVVEIHPSGTMLKIKLANGITSEWFNFNLVDRVEEPAAPPATEPETEPEEPVAPPTADEAKLEEIRKRRAENIAKLKAKLGSSQANIGVDPETVTLMIDIVRSYIEEGIVNFRKAIRAFHAEWGSRAEELDEYIEGMWEDLTDEKVSVKDAVAANAAEAAAHEAKYKPELADQTGRPEGQPKRNQADSWRLEAALSSEAQKNLDRWFEKRNASRDLRRIREGLEVYDRLLTDEPPDKELAQQAADELLAAAEAFFTNESEGNALRFSQAVWDGLVAITGNEDPDPSELLENEIFASAQEAGHLIWATLDPITAEFDVTEFNTAFGDVEFRRDKADVFPHIKAGRKNLAVTITSAPAAEPGAKDRRKPEHEISQDEANQRIQEWKDEAARIGREEDHSNEVVYSLFDVTGHWSQPWVDAGYIVRRYDIQKGQDMMDFGAWMMDVEEDISEGRTIVGIIGAPPCTSFAVSGNRWWQEQHNTANPDMVEKKYGLWARQFFEKPIDYAHHLIAVMKLIVEQADPLHFYALENPVGRMRKLHDFPPAWLTFDPSNFGDPYTKITQLWGSFDNNLPTANVYASEGSKIHKLRGDVEEDKLERAETPLGFAYSFFIANHRPPVAATITEDTDVEPEVSDDRDGGGGTGPTGGGTAPRGPRTTGEGGMAPPTTESGDVAGAGGDRTSGGLAGDGGRDSGAGAGSTSGRSPGADAASDVDSADDDGPQDIKDADARGAAPRTFVISDDGDLTQGGKVSKLNDNLAAIRLLKQLDAEGRPASAAEQLILSRYVGWGNTELKAALHPEGVDAIRDPKLKEARQILDMLLTPEELRRLADSVENAHYSFTELPRAMWRALDRFGFKFGSILEPAVGTGHFLGTMPGSIMSHARTRVMGVDMEPIAAGISRHLYQNANIQTSALEEAVIPKDWFDLVISNVPFSDIGVFDPEFVSGDRTLIARRLHNYYFGKALDAVRPGGLIAFVTSKGTLDSLSDVHRRYIMKRAKFLGAIRLPDQAFSKNAGTRVVTDVIFLQRRDADVTMEEALAEEPQWLNTVRRDDLPTGWDEAKAAHVPFQTNEYYQTHPFMVLGKESDQGQLYRQGGYTVEGELTPAMLDEAIGYLPHDIYVESKLPPRELAAPEEAFNKQGTYVLKNGKLFMLDKGTLVPSPLDGDDLKRVLAFLPIRDAYQRLLDALMVVAPDDVIKKYQKEVVAALDAFVDKWGPVNKRVNQRLIEEDPNGTRITALENFTKEGQTIVVQSRADILTEGVRVIAPPQEPATAESPEDALTQSLAWKGTVDLDFMGQLLQMAPADVAQKLIGEIYQDPISEVWEHKALYLSGDVVTKLAQAQARADIDPIFAANVKALEAVQPVPLTPEQFKVPFGATYVPIELYRQFIAEVTNLPVATIQIRLLNTENRVEFFVGDLQGSHEYLPEGARLGEWIYDTLNGKLPTIYAEDADGNKYKDVPATEAYHQSLDQLREQWAEWWPVELDAAEMMTGIHNAMFNRSVNPKFDEVPLILPNASPAFVFRPWQNRGVTRVMLTGNTLINHAMGSGKTLEGVAIASEWKRRRLARKPMIVVPNPVVNSWRSHFLAMYPTAKVLITTKEDFQKANRKRLLARITNNDWDVIIIGHTQFESIPVKTEYLRAFIQKQEDELIAHGAEQMGMSVGEFTAHVNVLEQADIQAKRTKKKVRPPRTPLSARETPRTVRDIVRAVKRLRLRLRTRLAADEAGESAVTFEEMGIDALIVDEAHYFKNLYFTTSMNDIKGLKGSDADRAIDMFLKVRQINDNSKNRNLVFLTGTPITNTMSEVYTLFRYLAQNDLTRLGMAGADSFFHNYAIATSELEPKPGGGYKDVVRLRKWNNLKELSALAGRFTDTVTIAEMVESGHLKIPKMKNGKPTILATKPHKDADDFMADIRHRLDLIKAGEPRLLRNDDEGNPVYDNYLVVSGDAQKFAIDPRLVDDKYEEDPNGRLPTAAKKIAEVYKETTAEKGTQLVFLDIGVPAAKNLPPLPDHVLKGKVTEEEIATATESDVDEGEAEAREIEDQLNATDRDLYTELKLKLIAEGVEEDEIAFIHQAGDNPQKTALLFKAVNEGRIRVLIATRAKGGVGVNIQKKVAHIIHMDVPWRPDQVDQADARAFRHGNERADLDLPVEKTIMVTEKSFDEFQWGLLATKNLSFADFWKGVISEFDDVDIKQAAFELASAVSTGDPRHIRVLQLEKEVRGLSARLINFESRQRNARRDLASAEGRMTHFDVLAGQARRAIEDPQGWDTKPIIKMLVDVRERWGSKSVRALDTTRDIDISTKEGKEEFQALLKELLPLIYYETVIANGGPFKITATKTKVIRGTGRMVKRTGVFGEYEVEETEELSATVMAVTVGDLVMGSTSPWASQEDAPEFLAGLRNLMSLARVKTKLDDYEAIQQKIADQITSVQEVLNKKFPQYEELRAKRRELTQLRIALGMMEVGPQNVAEMKTVQDLFEAIKLNNQYEYEGALDAEQAQERNDAVWRRAEQLGLTEKLQAKFPKPPPPPEPSDDEGGAGGRDEEAVDEQEYAVSEGRWADEGGRNAGMPRGYPGYGLAAYSKPGAPSKKPPVRRGPSSLRPHDIARRLAEVMGNIPLLIGKTGRNNRGIYKHVGAIRTVLSDDYQTLLHELGHALDLMITPFSKSHNSGTIADELMEIGEPTSRKGYTPLQRRQEGVAEYVRQWILGDAELDQDFPEFSDAFNAFLKTDHPVAAALIEAREKTAQYLALPESEKFDLMIEYLLEEGTISTKREEVMAWVLGTYDDPQHGLSKMLTAASDDKYRLWEMERQIKGGAVDVGKSVYWLWRMLPGAVRRAEGFIRYKVRDLSGKVIGPSLYDALSSRMHRYKDIVRYMVARRADRAHQLGMQTGFTHAQVREQLKLGDDPEIAAAAKGLDDFRRAFLDYLQLEGFLPSDTRKAWEKVWGGAYIPFKRISDRIAGSVSGKARINPKQPRFFKRFRGSHAPIADPIATLIEDVYSGVSAALENKAMRELFALANQYAKTTGVEGGARWLEIIPFDKHPIRFDLSRFEKEIREELETAGIEVDFDSNQDLFKRMVTLWVPNKFAIAGKHYVSMVESDGSIVMAQVHDPALWEMINNHGAASASQAVKLLGIGASMLRGTATLNLPWMGRNIVKDFFAAYAYSDRTFTPIAWLKGMKAALSHDEAWQIFLHSLAGQSTFNAQDRNSLKRELRRMGQGRARKIISQVVFHPFDTLAALRELSEHSTRVGAMKLQMDKEEKQGGMTPAALRRLGVVGREVTQDFQKIGAGMRDLNRMSAFLAAMIGGWTRAGQELKEHPARLPIRMLPYVTMIVALYLLNKDDPDHDAKESWRKKNAHNIPVPKWLRDQGWGPFIDIPRPYEYGDIANIIEAAFDASRGDKQAWARMPSGGDWKQGLLDLVLTIAPTVFIPPIEVTANYSFFRDRPIFNPFELNLAPELQYNRWTSESAKWLGNVLGIAPWKIDHMMYGYASSLYRMGASGVDWAAGQLGAATEAPSKGPVLDVPFIGLLAGAFYKGEVPGRADIDEFYDWANKLEGQADTIRYKLKEGGASEKEARAMAKEAGFNVKTEGRTFEVTNRKTTALNKTKKDMAALRHDINAVYASTTLSPEQKKAELDAITLKLVNLARKTLGKPPILRESR